MEPFAHVDACNGQTEQVRGDGCDDNVVNVPLVVGLMLGGALIGSAVVTGAMDKLSDNGVITDLRILIGTIRTCELLIQQ